MRGLFSSLIIPALAASVGCSISSTEPKAVPASVKIVGPNPLFLNVTDSSQDLAANVFDARDVQINGQVRVVWSSTDTGVVRVDQAGLLTPRKSGVSTIHAVVDANGATVGDSIDVDVYQTVGDRSPSAR